ncbi:MAG: methyltransferase domain-containing protein [Oscillospiraceae bacterium]|nr:methyltransferase domain-containing protein [Oscillospiraceae bacterium]
MKLERWEKDMVLFMRHASEYSDYYQKLTEKMLPWLSQDSHICDAGSGLGYLSLALAPYVKQVTAVERNPNAAAVLTENCHTLGISNINACCSSIAEINPGKNYHAMVFCFFGQRREILQLAKRQCSGDVFVFTRNYDRHRFSAGTHRTSYEGYPQFADDLDLLGIPANKETFTLEFGQPFRNPEEAHRFFRVYSKDKNKDVLTDDFVRSQLIDTGRKDFPLYLPHQKHIGFLHFSAKDIPETVLEGE